MTSESNPESGVTCFGTYSGSTCQQNGYDLDGNLLYKTSPKANQSSSSTTVTTSLTYDALHRVLTKSFSDGTTPTVKEVAERPAAKLTQPATADLPTPTQAQMMGTPTIRARILHQHWPLSNRPTSAQISTARHVSFCRVTRTRLPLETLMQIPRRAEVVIRSIRQRIPTVRRGLRQKMCRSYRMAGIQWIKK